MSTNNRLLGHDDDDLKDALSVPIYRRILLNLGTAVPKTGTPVVRFLGTEFPNHRDHNDRQIAAFLDQPRTSTQTSQSGPDPDARHPVLTEKDLNVIGL